MKKYFRLIWIEFKKGKEYSLNFIGQMVYLPLQLLIIYFIWKFVFAGKAVIGGYSFSDMVVYYLVLKIFESAISPVGITAYEVWTDINQGNLSLFLSRPIYYPIYLFFQKIGYFMWGLVSGVLFLIIARLFLPVGMELQAARVFWSAESAFFGLVIMFTLFFCVGALTFWVENILTLRDNLWNVIRIFSGQIFPIALFPGVFRQVAEVLPFQYIYFVPISIVQGKLQGAELARMLASQAAWVCGMVVLAIWMWQRGTRRYTAQGG